MEQPLRFVQEPVQFSVKRWSYVLLTAFLHQLYFGRDPASCHPHLGETRVVGDCEIWQIVADAIINIQQSTLV